jgi:hypothetical protein
MSSGTSPRRLRTCRTVTQLVRARPPCHRVPAVGVGHPSVSADTRARTPAAMQCNDRDAPPLVPAAVTDRRVAPLADIGGSLLDCRPCRTARCRRSRATPLPGLCPAMLLVPMIAPGLDVRPPGEAPISGTQAWVARPYGPARQTRARRARSAASSAFATSARSSAPRNAPIASRRP